MDAALRCPTCGIMNAEGAKYCERCGYQLGGMPAPVQEQLFRQPQPMPTWNMVAGLVFIIFGFILLGIAWGSFIGDTADVGPTADAEFDWPDMPAGLIIASILMIAVGGLMLIWAVVKMTSDAL